MKNYMIILTLFIGALLLGCSPESPSIGSPPPAPSFTCDTTSPNHIIFTVTEAQGFMINWDFGIGQFANDYWLFPGQDSTFSQNNKDTVFYPFPDTYTITLTASNKGGATSYTREIVVGTFDTSVMHNTYWNLLTGGPDSLNGKTWVWQNDSTAYGYGQASNPSTYKDPIKNSFPLLKQKPAGVLNDEYVFALAHFRYENNCGGDFLFNWMWANNLLGSEIKNGRDSVFEYTPPQDATWRLVEQQVDTTKILLLSLSSESYLGICNGMSSYAGSSTYQILKLTEDTLFIRYEMANPDDIKTGTSRTRWDYLRLVHKK